MRFSVLILAALVSLSVALIEEDEDGILEVDEENLDEVLRIQPNIMVEFFSPTCPHCQSLEPIYAKVSKRLAEVDPPIRIGKCDTSEDEELPKKYEVDSLPTLLYF